MTTIMIDINVSWSCVHDHGNQLTYNFDVIPGEDMDQMVEDFCLDDINQEEHPCQTCQEIGFNDVEWSYADLHGVELADESSSEDLFEPARAA